MRGKMTTLTRYAVSALVWSCCQLHISGQTDTTPPEIQCPPDQTQIVPSESPTSCSPSLDCCLVLEYPPVNVVDDSGDEVDKLEYPIRGSLVDCGVFNIGRVVTIRATDSSDNVASCTFFVKWIYITSSTEIPQTTQHATVALTTLKHELRTEREAATTTIAEHGELTTKTEAITTTIAEHSEHSTSQQMDHIVTFVSSTRTKATSTTNSTPGSLATILATSKAVIGHDILNNFKTDYEPDDETLTTDTPHITTGTGMPATEENLIVIIGIAVGCSVPIILTIFVLAICVCKRVGKGKTVAPDSSDRHQLQLQLQPKVNNGHEDPTEPQPLVDRAQTWKYTKSIARIVNERVNQTFHDDQIGENSRNGQGNLEFHVHDEVPDESETEEPRVGSGSSQNDTSRNKGIANNILPVIDNSSRGEPVATKSARVRSSLSDEYSSNDDDTRDMENSVFKKDSVGHDYEASMPLKVTNTGVVPVAKNTVGNGFPRMANWPSSTEENTRRLVLRPDFLHTESIDAITNESSHKKYFDTKYGENEIEYY